MIRLIMIMMLGVVFSQASFAKSICKEKTQSVCQSSDVCSWVKTYKRKDGAQVKAHCKKKPAAKKEKAKNKTAKIKNKAIKPSLKEKKANVLKKKVVKKKVTKKKVTKKAK
jgi:hypothetical protein